MTRHRLAPVSLFALIALLAVGCQPGAEEAPPEVAEPAGERVENAQLGLAVAELPGFFKVVKNEGEVIELAPADPQVEGTLTITATEPETGGINLVASIEEHKADLESRQDGVYKGQRELGSQLGTAFYSRGQWTEGGRLMEETAIFSLHPLGDRKLVMTYSYPAGEDSGERLNDQLFGVLGEIGPATSTVDPAAPAEEEASDPASDPAAQADTTTDAG